MTKDGEFLIENMAMLIDSGMDLLASLRTLKDEVHSKKMKATINLLVTEVEDGSPLWKTLSKNKVLPESAVSLVRIGEATGQLAENLNVVAKQSQKERSFRSKVRSALMYPVIVLSMTFLIGIGISWFILPKLATIFVDMKMELPFITKVLIAFGLFLNNYGAVAVPLFLVFSGMVFYMTFVYKKTKFIGQNILFSLPIFRRLIVESELARFGYLLGTLLDAGIPILDSLNSIHDSTELHFYQRLYSFLNDNVKEGNSFKKSFDLYPNSGKYFPYFIQQIISAGEKSGNLSKSLTKIGESYEEKVETTTKNISILLEPIMLLIIFVGVILLALAVILPIYSLVGGLNH